jgi:hypothetical protein
MDEDDLALRNLTYADGAAVLLSSRTARAARAAGLAPARSVPGQARIQAPGRSLTGKLARRLPTAN